MFDWVSDFCNFLIDLFLSLLGLICDAIWWFFTSFYTWVVAAVSPLIEAVLVRLGFDVEPGAFLDFWVTMNFFVPLNETLSLLYIVFGFWVQVLLIKITLKLIPTVY